MKQERNLFVYGILFFLIPCLVSFHWMDWLDQGMNQWIEKLRNPTFTCFMKWVTHGGETIILLALSFFITLFHPKQGKHLFFRIFVVLLANQWLKGLFHRPRPTWRIMEVSGYSFPSGHTMNAVMFYGSLLSFFCRKEGKRNHKGMRLCLLLMIVLVLFSRIYLGVHYVSDVLGGIFASLFLLTVMEMFRKRKEPM